jgi:hypothetical protein
MAGLVCEKSFLEKNMFRCGRFASLVLLMVAVTSVTAYAQPQYYTAQDPSKASTVIYGIGKERITDVEFATMAASMFDNGYAVPTWGATFFFQQCYSGGMFNELEEMLPVSVPWAGGSASAHNKLAYADGSNSFYTVGLTEALSIHDATIGTANFARLLDPAGPESDGEYKGYDTPQSLFRNPGGNAIDMFDPHIQRHTAILFAGHADQLRHYKGIKDIYKALTGIYEYTNRPYTILVLGNANYLPGIPVFGDATKANLAAAFATLKPLMGNYTDFTFYGTDHGGLDEYFTQEESPMEPEDQWDYGYKPTDGLIQAVLDSIGTPQLVFEFDRLITPGVILTFNDQELGDAFYMQSEGKVIIDLDRDLLTEGDGTYLVEVYNGSDRRVILKSASFRSGAIDTPELLQAIPEPMTVVLLVAPLALMRSGRRAA